MRDWAACHRSLFASVDFPVAWLSLADLLRRRAARKARDDRRTLRAYLCARTTDAHRRARVRLGARGRIGPFLAGDALRIRAACLGVGGYALLLDLFDASNCDGASASLLMGPWRS